MTGERKAAPSLIGRIVGETLVTGATVAFGPVGQQTMSRIPPWLRIAGASSSALAIIYCAVVAMTTAGCVASRSACEPTFDQPLYAAPLVWSPPAPALPPDKPVTPPLPAPSPNDVLRLAWDSEADVNWTLTERLASMSNSAYLDPVDAEEEYDKLGFEKVTPILAVPMFGVVPIPMVAYVASDDDVTVVAFRGTHRLVDWIKNLDFLRTSDTAHGPMHRGFHDSYESFKAQLFKLLEKRKPRHLWLTGHSLGGALALACAYDLTQDKRYTVHGVVTFGEPMIAKKQLADYLDTTLMGRHARFVNEQDIVPTVPPRYTPTGSLVWFLNGEIKRSPSKRPTQGTAPSVTATQQGVEIVPISEAGFEALKAELQVQPTATETATPGIADALAYPHWIADHFMDRYLEKIHTESLKHPTILPSRP